MSESESVQARISTFESLSSTNSIDFLESLPPSTTAATRLSPSPSPPNLGRKTSFIDLKDWVVDDGPSLSSKRISNGINATKRQSQSQDRSSIPTTLTVGVPHIDLTSPQKPKPKPKPKPADLTGAPAQVAVAAAASVERSPPQLPPRHASHQLTAISTSNPQLKFLYPPRSQDSLTVEPHSRSSSHAPSSSVSSFHSVSLSSDTDTSRPGSASHFIATFPIERERSSSSMASALNDADSLSLTESYEEVSVSSLASPSTLEKFEWQYAGRKPPKLPDRPPSVKPPPSLPPRGLGKTTSGSVPSSPVIRPSLSRHSSVSTLNVAAPPYSPYTPRRVAPPPPPSRSSDRSSILSTTTSHSSHSYQSPPSGVPITPPKTKRPTPVPLAARKRYETVFIKNVLQQRKAQKAKENEKSSPGLLSPPPEVARNRRAAGWRGLSVDLIVSPEAVPEDDASPQWRQQQEHGNVDETVGNNAKLEGPVVKLIWKKSGLNTRRLAEIWNECDVAGQGALNLDSFAKGMWRIDEDLRRTQAQVLKSTTNSLGVYRTQSVRSLPQGSTTNLPRLPPRYKDILR